MYVFPLMQMVHTKTIPVDNPANHWINIALITRAQNRTEQPYEFPSSAPHTFPTKPSWNTSSFVEEKEKMRITLQIYPRSERNEGKMLLDTSAASRRSIILIASKIARKRRRERRSGAINDELKWKTRRMNRRRFIKVLGPPTESIFFRSFRGRYSNSCGKRARRWRPVRFIYRVEIATATGRSKKSRLNKGTLSSILRIDSKYREVPYILLMWFVRVLLEDRFFFFWESKIEI